MNKLSLIVSVKNRLQHFKKIFTSLITQRIDGLIFELVIVDYHSNDNLQAFLKQELISYNDIFSPELSCIKVASVHDDLKFNPRKSKNLGAKVSDGNIFAYTDADVFLSMDYLDYWKNFVRPEKSFVATRVQANKQSDSKRIRPEINYGNCLITRQDFYSIGGWDESVSNYGGDDDDFYHRLQLKGLCEINPRNFIEAKQYSILHNDDLRLKELEDPTRCDPEQRFKEIYANTNYINNKNDFLKKFNKYELNYLYEKI